MNDDKKYLLIAIDTARESVANGFGGPFGAVIVKEGKILAAAANNVLRKADPTAHAEVEAIRIASQKIGHHWLPGCTLYSTCEPCPMCMGAAYWARIDRIVYASNRHDAEEIGFIDQQIFADLVRPPEQRKIKFEFTPLPEADALFREWSENQKKEHY